MQIKEYWPRFFQDLIEFDQIAGAEQPEFTKAVQNVQSAPDNFFLSTLTEYGCRRWESILGISVSDTESLETRRFRIASQMGDARPYTIPQLKNILRNLCGEDNYSVQVSDYVLIVRIGLTSRSNYSDIEALLQKISPANMVIDLSLAYNQHQSLQTMTHAQLAAMTHYEIRNEIMKG